MKNTKYKWEDIKKLIQSAEKREKVDYSLVKWAIHNLSDEGIVDAERIMGKKYLQAYDVCKTELDKRMSLVGMDPEDFLEDLEIKFILFEQSTQSYMFCNRNYVPSDIEREFFVKYYPKFIAFPLEELQWRNGDICFKDNGVGMCYTPSSINNLIILRKAMEPTDYFLKGEIKSERDNWGEVNREYFRFKHDY